MVRVPIQGLHRYHMHHHSSLFNCPLSSSNPFEDTPLGFLKIGVPPNHPSHGWPFWYRLIYGDDWGSGMTFQKPQKPWHIYGYLAYKIIINFTIDLSKKTSPWHIFISSSMDPGLSVLHSNQRPRTGSLHCRCHRGDAQGGHLRERSASNHGTLLRI